MATTEKARPEGTPAIRLTALTKYFGDFTALDSIDLEVADGEFFTLLGPSGSGKTTTLRLIAGFEEPTGGQIELMGQDIEGHPPFERDVNTVFQDYALFPHMSVTDNVAYSLKVAGVGRSQRRATAEEALATVRLGGLGSRRPSQLSGGQRQRVALARAIVANPKVLLLDEPLGALDLKLREEMQVELSSIQRELGITFIYVTHDQDEALGMSDRLAVFNEGRIEQVGTPVEVYCHPASEFVSGFVGVSNVLEVDGRRFTVRPERISLAPAGRTAETGRADREGVISDRRFGGQSTRWTIDLGSGETLVVVEQNAREDDSTGPAVGDRVIASWARESEIALPAAGNQ